MEIFIQQILKELADPGYSVVENLFDKDILLDLQKDIQAKGLKKAGVSKAAQVHHHIRGDLISWLDRQDLTHGQKVVTAFLENLRSQLNAKLFLGIKDFEFHVTMYPVGTFYQRHLDQFQNTQNKKRVVSFILYLNDSWKEVDGGELVLHTSVPLHIQPTFGKMVFFLSQDFEHEVLTTNRERFSLTGWMYQY